VFTGNGIPDGLTVLFEFVVAERGDSTGLWDGAEVPQAAAAVHQIAIAQGASCDLYAQLCEVETLRMGWMRVKGSRSKAAGVDGITPQHFAQRCESEIAVLAASLRSGHYQARPLRRILS